MANYNPIYQCTFDSIVSQSYSVIILKKGYTGSVRSIMGSGTPVVHSWDTDDPKPGIKGSNVRISFINDGALPIQSFYSVEDDGFKAQIFWGTQLLFEGFIVQDDCSEEMIDYTHEINLSANDNLGLLKDVPLNHTSVVYNIYNEYVYTVASVAPHGMIVEYNLGVQLLVEDRLRFQNTGSIDGIYTITQIDYDAANHNYGLQFLENIVTSPGPITSAHTIILRPTLALKVSLLSVIKSCILAAGLELPLNVYSNLYEVSQNITSSFLDQTRINPDTFLKNDTEYMSCYDVLQFILQRFGMTLMQANGYWNLIRWDELRYFNNQITGYGYDKDFTLTGTIAMPSAVNIGPTESVFPQTGLLNRVHRPFKHVKETFNYKSPANLLRNYNLLDLGQLLNTYPTGTGTNLITHKEYAFKWWTWSNNFPTSGTPATYFIRVDYDYLGNEINRYVVLRNNGVHSVNIEVNKGDSFTLSFSVNSDISLPGPANMVFIVKVTDGTTTKYLREPLNASPGWQNGPGWVYKIQTGDNIQNKHNVTIDANSSPIPFDGMLTVFLNTETPNPTNETQYSDIRFQYIPKINESTKITGQTHTNTQTPVIKQVDDIDVLMDDAPKNSIDGCLYLNSMNGLLQSRTYRWNVGAFTPARRLGEQTTLEELFWRRVPRTLLEGSIKGLINNGVHLSAITTIKYTGSNLQALNFVWGKMEIDYKNDIINSSTLYEIWQDTEVDANLIHEYLFQYIYSVK